jgi:hypothetical protein
MTIEAEASDLVWKTRSKGNLALGVLNKQGLRACDRIGATILLNALDKANGSSLGLESIMGSKPSWTPKGEGLRD